MANEVRETKQEIIAGARWGQVVVTGEERRLCEAEGCREVAVLGWNECAWHCGFEAGPPPRAMADWGGREVALAA